MTSCHQLPSSMLQHYQMCIISIRSHDCSLPAQSTNNIAANNFSRETHLTFTKKHKVHDHICHSNSQPPVVQHSGTKFMKLRPTLTTFFPADCRWSASSHAMPAVFKTSLMLSIQFITTFNTAIPIISRDYHWQYVTHMIP